MRRLSLATWVGSAQPQEITFSLELQHPHVLAVVRMFPPQPTVSSGVTCRWMKSMIMLPPYKDKQKNQSVLVLHLLVRSQQLVPISDLLPSPILAQDSSQAKNSAHTYTWLLPGKGLGAASPI